MRPKAEEQFPLAQFTRTLPGEERVCLAERWLSFSFYWKQEESEANLLFSDVLELLVVVVVFALKSIIFHLVEKLRYHPPG